MKQSLSYAALLLASFFVVGCGPQAPGATGYRMEARRSGVAKIELFCLEGEDCATPDEYCVEAEWWTGISINDGTFLEKKRSCQKASNLTATPLIFELSSEQAANQDHHVRFAITAPGGSTLYPR